MSTKTTFKRVALVAVAALGLGVISVAPSSAAILSGVAATNTMTMSSSSTTIVAGETATATFTSNFIAGVAGDSITVDAFATHALASGTMRLYVTDSSSAVASNVDVTTPGASNAAGSTITFGAKAAGAVIVTAKLLVYAPTVAGTYTYSLYAKTGAAGAAPSTQLTTPLTWTFTVTAAAKKPDATSTAYIGAGSNIPVGSDSASVTAIKTPGTQAALIKVTQLIASSATNAAESMTAVITGAGTLGGGPSVTQAATGRALTVKYNDYITVWSDGTSGTGTITVTGNDSGLTYKVASVLFYDPTPKTATVTVKKAYPAAGKTTSSAVNVVVVDSSGNAVTNAASVYIEPLTTGTGETSTACAYSSTSVAYVCSALGSATTKFGKVSYKAHVTGADTAATEIYSSAFDLTFADIIATKVTVTAPATANVGDKVTVTLTATEKNGYPVADATYEGGQNNTVGGIFWNTTTVPTYSTTAFAPFAPGETITTTSGVATAAVYLPAVSGIVTRGWTFAGTAGGTASVGAIDKTILGTTASISIAVSNPGVDAATDAANEATDAANAATDAALAAADAADAATMAAQDASDAVATLSASVSKLIASLKAQITTLTNLVIKIQKKVKA
jgi:hypothetical protein